MLEINANYERVWLAMANDDVTQYKAIQSLSVFEYWGIFDTWKTKQEQKIKHHKQQQAKQGKNGR